MPVNGITGQRADGLTDQPVFALRVTPRQAGQRNWVLGIGYLLLTQGFTIRL